MRSCYRVATARFKGRLHVDGLAGFRIVDLLWHHIRHRPEHQARAVGVQIAKPADGHNLACAVALNSWHGSVQPAHECCTHLIFHASQANALGFVRSRQQSIELLEVLVFLQLYRRPLDRGDGPAEVVRRLHLKNRRRAGFCFRVFRVVEPDGVHMLAAAGALHDELIEAHAHRAFDADDLSVERLRILENVADS